MKRFLAVLYPFSAVIGGAIAGGAVSWLLMIPRLDRIESRLSVQTRTATSTNTAVEIVPVVPRPFAPSLPDPLVARRLSSVATIVRRLPGKPPAEAFFVPQDREVGVAVALTSDGWFASTHAGIGGHHIADLWLLWNGHAYAIKQAVRDTATDALFLKVDAKDAPVSAFVRAQNIVVGVPVWLEPRAGRLYPGWIADTRWRQTGDPVPSERAARRMMVNVPASGSTWIGGAAWDGAGQLIGFIEGSSSEGWRLLPAGDVARSLESLLASGKITHASLGIRVSDRAHLVSEADGMAGNGRGAWLRSDRRSSLPAVDPQGPAGKILREGDVIERIEHDILDGSADLGEMLLEYRPGSSVTLAGFRDGKPVQWKVTLGSAITSEAIK